MQQQQTDEFSKPGQSAFNRRNKARAIEQKKAQQKKQGKRSED